MPFSASRAAKGLSGSMGLSGRGLEAFLPVIALRLALSVVLATLVRGTPVLASLVGCALWPVALWPVALRSVASGSIPLRPIGLRPVGTASLTLRAVTAGRAGVPLFPLRSGGAFCPFGTLKPGFRGPGEGVERLHLRRGFGGRVFRFRHRGEDRDLFRDRLACRNRGGSFGRNLGRFRGLDRLDLDPLGLFALVAQPGHQIGKLVQRHPGDRQHVRRRLEPGAAVLLPQDIGQTLQHVDADRAGSGGVVACKGIVMFR
ncbi:MAG: hypothetical protein B7Z38_06980, partial [Rhodobacterales bacterium 12-64-8]